MLHFVFLIVGLIEKTILDFVFWPKFKFPYMKLIIKHLNYKKFFIAIEYGK